METRFFWDYKMEVQSEGCDQKIGRERPSGGFQAAQWSVPRARQAQLQEEARWSDWMQSVKLSDQ